MSLEESAALNKIRFISTTVSIWQSLSRKKKRSAKAWHEPNGLFFSFSSQGSGVMLPVVKDICNGLEATGRHTTRTCVTAIHCPKHEVALVWIQFQQQHHSLTTQLVNLEEIIEKLLGLSPGIFY